MIELYQIRGICQKRKHWFGLSWKTYESFKDSQLLGRESVKKRLKALDVLSLTLCENSDSCSESLKGHDLSDDIIAIEELRIYPVMNGDYLGGMERIYMHSNIKEQLFDAVDDTQMFDNTEILQGDV